MVRFFNASRPASRFALLALVATLALGANGRPIKKLTFDPAAPTIDLFDGIEQGVIDAVLIPKNAEGGNVFIENKTDKPITVKLPKAVAAVQVLKQGFGAGAAGGAAGGAGGGGGGGQAVGGGMGGGGGGMGGGGGGMGGGGGGMGGGFFSIPPEKVVQVPFKSVCLNHGKPDPRPKMTYKLVRIESYTSDPVLQELLKMYASGKIEYAGAQAAAWHLTDNMSWQELAAKETPHLGGVAPTPYFAPADLMSGQQLVAQASARARERSKEEAPAAETSRSVRTSK